jgi:ribosomal protein L7Ae-like RNA K-turn-binding protein
VSDAALRLLGLGLRAGTVVIGVSGVRAALQRGTAQCAVVAADASPRTADTVTRLARGKGVPLVTGPAAQALGQALGRPPVQAVAVTDGALARGVLAASGGV